MAGQSLFFLWKKKYFGLLREELSPAIQGMQGVWGRKECSRGEGGVTMSWGLAEGRKRGSQSVDPSLQSHTLPKASLSSSLIESLVNLI